MNQPLPGMTGIRASAVLAILGSAVTLLLAGLILFAGFFAPPLRNTPPPPVSLKAAMTAIAAIWAAFAAWGIATGIGIFTRRVWARISILIFAVLLTFFGLSAMLVTVVFLKPPTTSPDFAAVLPKIRFGIAAFYCLLALVGVWWLVLFNRDAVKQYFAGQEPANGPTRPLSVIFIAWLLLICAACNLALAVFHVPAVLLG